MEQEKKHRERPAHVLQAILENNKVALKAMSRKGNASPRRKRPKLTPVEREAARIRRNEEQKQKRAAEKERRKRMEEARQVAEQEERAREEEARQDTEDERLAELNAMADAFRERSLRAQYYAGAQWHARHLGYADD